MRTISCLLSVAALVSTAGAVRAQPAADPRGSRPAHLWTLDYLKLLGTDTGATLTAPVRWDEGDWLHAALAGGVIGGTAAFDHRIKVEVQGRRSPGLDRFMSHWQNFGRIWSFGVLGAFEVWGEAGGDGNAKATAMDGIAASIIGPGLIGTSLKEIVGRVRPNTETRTFEFKPFSGNVSFPSGDAFQAFTVATVIAEHYPQWWVQTLCYGTAGLVGYARIEQNAHHASDVVAGAILGYAISRSIVHRHNLPNPHRLSWSPYSDGIRTGVVFFKSF